jgi:hypothetical protein
MDLKLNMDLLIMLRLVFTCGFAMEICPKIFGQKCVKKVIGL